MPLAAPTGLSVTRLWRVLDRTEREYYYFARLTWTNTESNNHFVSINLSTTARGGIGKTASQITLSRGAQSADVIITRFDVLVPIQGVNAGQNDLIQGLVDTDKTINISVTIGNGDEESSAANATASVSLYNPEPLQVTSNFVYDGQGGLFLPNNWTGVLELNPNLAELRFDEQDVPLSNAFAGFRIDDLSNNRINAFNLPHYSDNAPREPESISLYARNQFNFAGKITTTSSFLSKTVLADKGDPFIRRLFDGRFYRASATFLRPIQTVFAPAPFFGYKFYTSYEEIEVSRTFEYYKNGPAVPKFTSPLSTSTFIDTDFRYVVTADDSRSTFSVNLGSATGLTFDGTNAIEGSVATAGDYNIGLVATNSFGTSVANLDLEVKPFTAFDGNATIVRNATARVPLTASHRAQWNINSGAPAGFSVAYFPENFGTATGPEEAFLVGTPAATGSFPVLLTASRSGASPAQTSTATLNLTVADSLPATTINASADILRNGITAQVGRNISVALSSIPSPATWFAEGLPDGITIDANGRITGAARQEGTFFAAITARAPGREISQAVNIRFVITPATVAVATGTTAAQRSPWLLQQWEITDLHILTRSRVVQSTLFENGALRIKLGDAINFAVFFVNQNNAVFSLAPTQLRLTIRKADNLDDLIIFKSATPPESATTQSQTYYLMPVTTGNREREVALEWAEENGKNEPLACVADLDWIKDGKLYSSRTFPVLLELDVTRP